MLTNMLPRFPTALMATLLLVAVTACDELPTEPNGLESEVAPVGTSSSGMPMVMKISDSPLAIANGSLIVTALSPASSSTSVVYSSLGDLTWPSLGYQANQTWESGDFVSPTRPGVLSNVDIGMSSWACQHGGWSTGDCESEPGATFDHLIKLNLYAVDYTNADPAPGALIASIEQSFDIPFRPSADDHDCTGADAGKFHDERFGACVNGYNTTITFDLSSQDIVIPAEFIFGVEFNTQSAGPEPLNSDGPHNSLNVGLQDETFSTIGQSVLMGDLLWEATGVPFDLYQFGAGWPYMTAAKFEVTNEGFVTGGGWFTSPPGAFMPSDATVVTETDIDQPTDSDIDWLRFETNAGNGVFAAGPGTPPLGSGSFQMSSTDGADKVTLFNYDHIGTRLSDIESIGYATYRSSASTNSAAQYPAINIQVDFDGSGSSFTTLVWEPLYVVGQSGLLTDTWQTWDAMAPSQTSFPGGWWSTNPIPGVCAFSCFVTWDDIVTNNPNAKIKFGFGVNIGSGWNGVFSGAADALSITTSGTTTTYDFEEAAPADPTGKASFGFVSRYKKGANTPSGNTQFTFEAGDLNFHSTSYDWLVVNQGDSNAQFKGEGTINGSGSYEFMLWAGDKDPDTFRIKIWETVGGQEEVVYDNGTDQPIEGGQIVIHGDKGKE